MTLTQKQDDFCLKYVELGNASEAYRQVYNAENMKPETVNRKAKELMDNGKIKARIKELQAEHSQRHNITIDDLLDELETARKGALQNGAYGVAVSATMGKAKILGFDKRIIDHTSSDESLKPQIHLTNDEFRKIAEELLEKY